jgi:parallel beta-helix repeat protein
VVTITATEDAGWKFLNWSGVVGDPNSSGTTVTVNADKTITANFAEISPPAGAGMDHSGLISSSETWYKKDNPHIVTGDVEVYGDKSPILTLEAGVVVKFKSDTSIIVGDDGPGGLIANGSSGQITFTSNVATPAPGDWSGIAFEGSAMDGDCKLINCLIEYGGAWITGKGDFGNIYCLDASPTISNCSINYSKLWGIYRDGNSNPALSGNTFTGNVKSDVYTP